MLFIMLLYRMEFWILKCDGISLRNKYLRCGYIEECWRYLELPRLQTEILRRINKNTKFINTIMIRKLQCLGHIMKNESRYSILQSILQGKNYGRRGSSRKISWLLNLWAWFENSSSKLFCVATDKVGIAIMVANIWNRISTWRKKRI